jgi:hypothetical protein
MNWLKSWDRNLKCSFTCLVFEISIHGIIIFVLLSSHIKNKIAFILNLKLRCNNIRAIKIINPAEPFLFCQRNVIFAA